MLKKLPCNSFELFKAVLTLRLEVLNHKQASGFKHQYTHKTFLDALWSNRFFWTNQFTLNSVGLMQHKHLQVYPLLLEIKGICITKLSEFILIR